ncbi:MAG TPA: hypothetical protein ENG33_01715 [Chloroflexi bacterium]|nr:hypothetical protein [Chloroflexota bacterium]
MSGKSLRMRRRTFAAFFLGLIPISVFVHYPVIKGMVGNAIHTAGILVTVLALAFAFYVHSLFPSKHDNPGDFDRLLTDGPYRYVRHPFYAAFIVMGFGIALFLVSVPGLIFNVLLIPAWVKLAELEEAELLELWGDEYKRFMETRPRFFPRMFRRKPG